jgi:hypothetical protein
LGRFSARASSSSRGDAVLLQYPKDKHAFDPVTGVFKLLHPQFCTALRVWLDFCARRAQIYSATVVV